MDLGVRIPLPPPSSSIAVWMLITRKGVRGARGVLALSEHVLHPSGELRSKVKKFCRVARVVEWGGIVNRKSNLIAGSNPVPGSSIYIFK